jgi:hypothetical protein
METISTHMKPRYSLGAATVMIGSGLNYFGDRLLGVKIELYRGLLDKFSLPSMLDVFLVPFVVGLVVALIFGRGGKWLCYFPPMIVRTVSYVSIYSAGVVPVGSRLIPIGWWGFFVILAVESSAIGGVLGEVMVKRTYGRSPAGGPMRKKLEPGSTRRPDA